MWKCDVVHGGDPLFRWCVSSWISYDISPVVRDVAWCLLPVINDDDSGETRQNKDDRIPVHTMIFAVFFAYVGSLSV